MAIKLVLISGGREIGGLNSFANNLREGFEQIGIPALVLSTSNMLRRWKDLRDPSVLKVLSTTAVYLAPVCCHSVCVAHGFPRKDIQSLAKALGILYSFRLAERCSTLIAVSHYVRIHLKSAFNINCGGTIYNALSETYLQSHASCVPRKYITYVGRLSAEKNVALLVEPIRRVLDLHPGMGCIMIGEGDAEQALRKEIRDDRRFSLLGSMNSEAIRSYLQRTAVFVSGCETEALGISYLEALSQGCNVVMPACGGGLEICTNKIGAKVFLLPLDFEIEKCIAVIDRAVPCDGIAPDMTQFSPTSMALRYLNVRADVAHSDAVCAALSRVTMLGERSLGKD